MRAGVPDRAYGAAGLALLCLLLACLPESLAAQLSWERGAILGGQWWRLWTGHLVHFGLQHAMLDAIVLFAGASLLERELGTRRLLRQLLLAAPLIALGLLAAPAWTNTAALQASPRRSRWRRASHSGPALDAGALPCWPAPPHGFVSLRCRPCCPIGARPDCRRMSPSPGRRTCSVPPVRCCPAGVRLRAQPPVSGSRIPDITSGKRTVRPWRAIVVSSTRPGMAPGWCCQL